MEEASKIRNYALKLLTGRMYAREELSKKLVRKFPEEQKYIPEILDEFVMGKILDDKVYAETYVRFRQGSAPRGKFALRMELKKKGIPEDIIAATLEEISEENEQEKAADLVKKKLRTFPVDLSEKQKKEKLFRFLTARGFSQAVIFRLLEL